MAKLDEPKSGNSKFGSSGWYKYMRKYVWDDQKTPYLIASDKLTQKQADNEIFAYVCLISIAFSVVAIIFASANSPYGQLFGLTFYAFSVAISAIMLNLFKHIYPAIYCGLAPIAILLFFLIKGFPPNTHAIDWLVLVAFLLLWAWYSLRIINIAKMYDEMPKGDDA